MIWAFEVDTARRLLRAGASTEALARDVLLRPIGRTVYFMPPYVIADAEFALLVDATLAILERA